jgi:hypothetical protein
VTRPLNLEPSSGSLAFRHAKVNLNCSSGPARLSVYKSPWRGKLTLFQRHGLEFDGMRVGDVHRVAASR